MPPNQEISESEPKDHNVSSWNQFQIENRHLKMSRAELAELYKQTRIKVRKPRAKETKPRTILYPNRWNNLLPELKGVNLDLKHIALIYRENKEKSLEEIVKIIREKAKTIEKLADAILKND